MTVTPRVVLCDQDLVDAFEPEADRIVEALLGHTQALVTDLSDVGDFLVGSDRSTDDLDALMGRAVGRGERIGELARELAAKDADAKALRH